MKVCLILGGLAAAATLAPASVGAETLNWRNSCDRWEHIPASESLDSPETALLFCSNDADQKWLALQVHCDVSVPTMVIRYRPGFDFEPPVIAQEIESGTEGGDQLSAEDREAAALVAAILITTAEFAQSQTPLVGQRKWCSWIFGPLDTPMLPILTTVPMTGRLFEKQPLSPVFSRMVSGNFADIKLLAYDKTERFPLRGSSKALRPVIEVCRIAKREADRAAKN